MTVQGIYLENLEQQKDEFIKHVLWTDREVRKARTSEILTHLKRSKMGNRKEEKINK